MIGRPRHYLAGGGAGFAVAAVAAAILIRLRIGSFGFLGSALIGYAVGSVVVRAASNLRHSGIQATAAVATALGLVTGSLLAGFPVQGLVNGRFIVSTLIASGFAAFRAGR
ncbi:MAG: hypothetical protein ACR2FO_06230 [Actinomycetota bacterium]